ncbi:MAG: HvfX family Cu-binding RiPP maturation protein [Gammaproteobacteria bacterium]
MGLFIWCQNLFDRIRNGVDFIGPLLLRIYLVPVFFIAGSNKWSPFEDGGTFNPAEGLASTADWFGNPDWGLGLPFPLLMALLAWAAEIFGAIALALGFAVRWVCIPLMFTMIVAATTVHCDKGWQAVHDVRSPYPAENAAAAAERLARANSILKEHGNYRYLTEHGNFVVANNGVEWAATYFVMLIALMFLGAGRFFSIDYWLNRKFRPSR